MKLFIIAHVPDGLEKPLLQAVRDFDTKHPGCHFEIGIDGPDEPLAAMVERLQIDPALTFTQIFKRKRTDCCRRYAIGETFCDDCPATIDNR